MPEADVAEPGRSLIEFLGKMQIEHVVYVDDAYDRGPDMEATIAWIVAQHPRKIKSYFDEFRVEVDPQDEELSISLRSWLEDGDNGEAVRSLLAKVLLDRLKSKDHQAYDQQVMTRLGELLVGYDRFLPIGPGSWDERAAEILDWSEQGRVLLIFDDELGGDHKKGSDILDEIIRDRPESRLLLGLLSYNIKEGQENDVTKAWKAKGAAIPVTGISKEAIADDAGEGELVLRIRAAVLWKESEVLRARVDGHLADSIRDASLRVRDLTALDFDEAVFQASRLEGAHEADSLLRLYASLVMARLRERLRGDQDSLRDLDALRAFSDMDREHRRAGSEAWKLQREELYESGEYVNGCHMPTDVGDVYRLSSPAKGDKPGKVREFVLVAPPCDVAVRTEGKRKARTGILCPIGEEEPTYGMRLDFFDGESGESRWVNVAKWMPIPLWILDLCATNGEGLSKLDVTAEVPSVLSTGWKVHHAELCSCGKTTLERHLKPAEETGGKRTLPTPVSSSFELDDGSTIVFECEENKVSFGVGRNMRLAPLLARELVETYSRYVSRPARPHALTLELRTKNESKLNSVSD